MPVFLSDELSFPSADHADEHGIIALGGDLSTERLIKAYSQGIFPWPHQGLPLLWFFPDPRFVLEISQFIINKSLKKAIKRSSLEICADRDFASVIKACSVSDRPENAGTWITEDIIQAYIKFHQLGYAHSIEAYQDGELVGGLYGVAMGKIFFGESMFFKAANASKICFVTLVAQLRVWNYSLIDCQMETPNFEAFGAKAMSKAHFLRCIENNSTQETKFGPWQLTLTPSKALQVLKN